MVTYFNVNSGHGDLFHCQPWSWWPISPSYPIMVTPWPSCHGDLLHYLVWSLATLTIRGSAWTGLQTSSTSHPSNAATIKPDRLHPTTDSVIHLSEDTTKESMLIIPKEFSTDTVQGSCLWSQLNTAICPATEFTATSAHRRVAVTVHCTEAGCCHSPLHTDRLLSQSTADRQVAVTGPPHTDRLPSQSTAHRQDAVAVILQPCTQCTACKVEVLQQTTWWLYYGRCPAQHTHPHQPTSTALHSKETLTASDKLTHTCIILYYAPLKVFLFLPSPQFCFHHRPPDTGGNSHPVSLLD